MRLSLFMLTLAMACTDPPQTESTEAPEVMAPTPHVPPRIEDELFVLAITAQDEAIQLRIEPRGAHEMETRYPYRVSLQAEGGTLEHTELRRADATELTSEAAVFRVGTTTSVPQRVSAEVEFAVCSESGCVPFTRTVGMDLRIHSIAMGWGLDPASAEDVVQSTFLRLHQSRASIRVERPLGPWLVTVAMNLLRDGVRRAKHRRETPMDEEPGSVEAPDRALEASQAARALQKHLDRLPAAQREAVLAVRVGGLSYAQAAAALGKTEAATRQNVHRGLARLLRGLQEESRSDVRTDEPIPELG